MNFFDKLDEIIEKLNDKAKAEERKLDEDLYVFEMGGQVVIRRKGHLFDAE